MDTSGIQDDLVGLRRELHAIAEVGLDLPRTRERVLTELDGLPLELTFGESSSAITAVLRGGQPGPAVLLRGDMDALPLVEKTGVAFAAEGEVMHACGHDLHTTMLVGAAQVLAREQAALKGDVIFMFQPGEEGYDGAGHMIAEGVLAAAGRPLEAAYALHVTSSILPSGIFASRPGPLMAAAGTLTVTVHGQGGHGSMPQRAKDPIVVAAEMITALQTWVTRSFDVFDPVVLTVGQFHAGTTHNVIPDDAFFEATLRSFSAVSQARLLHESVRVVQGIAAAHGVDVEVTANEMYPVTVNDVARAAAVADLTRERFGEERFIEFPNPMTGSEDFSRVLENVPGAMVFLGAVLPGADAATAPYNHSPLAQFDESVLSAGVAMYAELALLHVG